MFVRIHSDNASAVHFLRRRRVARSRVLNSWVMSIGVFLGKGLFLSAFFVAGVLNFVAESLSRKNFLCIEWMLDMRPFNGPAAWVFFRGSISSPTGRTRDFRNLGL